MKKFNLFFLFTLSFLFMLYLSVNAIGNGDRKLNNNILDLSVKDMDGKEVHLESYKGKVLLIVNVASKCGNTPQYKGLESLYEKYKSKGFEILGFPCNDFGSQEPGTNDEIKNFCTSNYNVTFKLFDKIKVLSDDRSPLYARLINNDITDKGDVKWNFEKFLIDRDGNIVARFRDKVKPDNAEVVQAIEKELNK